MNGPAHDANGPSPGGGPPPLPSGLSPLPALALLLAYVLFAAVVTPFAGAAAIRNAQG